MRHIGTLQNLEQARVFTDYLAGLNISAHIEAQSSEWSIWIRDEDRLAEAKAALARYRTDPQQPDWLKQAIDFRQSQEPIHVAEAIETPEPWQRQLSNTAASIPFTLTLVWLCIFVALASDLGQSLTSSAMQSLAFCNPTHILNIPAADASGTQDLRAGEIWRVVTPTFLHFGPLHLAFNVILLLQFGRLFELKWGVYRLALIVLLTATVGNVGQYVCGGSSLFGGFTGVIFGLVAYGWVRTYTAPEEELPMSIEPVIILLVVLILGFGGVMDSMFASPPVATVLANWSHLFGMLTGAALAWVLPRRGFPQRKP